MILSVLADKVKRNLYGNEEKGTFSDLVIKKIDFISSYSVFLVLFKNLKNPLICMWSIKKVLTEIKTNDSILEFVLNLFKIMKRQQIGITEICRI